MKNKFFHFKWRLDTKSALIFFLLLFVGLRGYSPIAVGPLAPNFFEFNMYVYDIQSLKTGGEHPDLYFFDDSESRKYIEFASIDSRIHSGFLFQGDRWRRYPKLVKDFFCENRDLVEYKEGAIKISVEYLKNKREVVTDEYDFFCS